MREGFDEAYVAESLDPADGKVEQFDHEQVYEHLDGEPSRPDPAMQKAAQAIRELLTWTLASKIKGRAGLEVIGLRVAALAWTLRPEMFNGGISAAKLAAHYGVRPEALHRITGQVREHFRIANRSQLRHAPGKEAHHES
jgi:hypothetical protein